jgi:hypothetical protein
VAELVRVRDPYPTAGRIRAPGKEVPGVFAEGRRDDTAATLASGGSVARIIFHGNQGELRQPYRDGQEDQLGALGFALNALVLWNAQYLDDAIGHLRATGHDIADEDVERLSPLQHEHIKMPIIDDQKPIRQSTGPDATHPQRGGAVGASVRSSLMRLFR